MSLEGTYHDSLETIKKEIAQLLNTNSNTHPLASAPFQKFLYESINFLSKTPEVKKCLEWFDVVCTALELLIQKQEEWDHKRLSHQQILTYLSHYLYHLVKIEGTPLEWYLKLGYATLEFLAAYSLTPGYHKDFTAKLVSNVYGCLYNCGQKAKKESRAEDSTQVLKVYELLLLACSIQCMDVTNANRDGLKSAKEFLTSLIPQLSPRQKCSQREVTSVYVLALKTFTLQQRDVQSESSQSYMIDLFRLTLTQRNLCEMLLGCEGNLYKVKLPKVTSYFPCDSVEKVRQHNQSVTADITENIAQDIVLSVLKFIFKLSSLVDGQENERNKPLKSSLELNFLKDIQQCISRLQELLSESHKPVSIAISDSLAALTHLKLDPKPMPLEVLLVIYQMMSVCVEVFVRDVLYKAAKESQTSLVSSRIYYMAVGDKTRMSALQALLNHDISDHIVELAELQKSTIKSLCILVQAVKKKNILALYPNGIQQVVKSLEDSVSSLGVFGRQLRRLGKYSDVIELLSPLWPMTSMDQLLPHISHHESLAECYRLTSQPNKVYQIVATAAKLDLSLVTEQILKTLIGLNKQDPNLPILKIFDSCKEDDAKHAMLLVRVVRGMMKSKQSLFLHKSIQKVLSCLVNHPGLTVMDKAMYTSYLAAVKWYSSHEMQEKRHLAEELMEMLTRSCSVLMSGAEQKYDDVVVQAVFLYWEMLHRLTCLEKVNTVEESLDSTPTQAPPVSTPRTPSEPPGPLDPQTPLEVQGTPERVKLVNRLASTSTPVSRAKSQLTKDKGKGRVALPCQVDSDMLMEKVKDCLAVWVQWFTTYHEELTSWEDGSFRAMKSLAFLDKVSEVAKVNHNILIGLQSVCYAKNLALKMKDTEAVQRLTARLLSLMSQLGVKYQDGVGFIDTGDKDLFIEDDVFLSSLGLGKDVHVLDLVSLAEYYYRLGEIHRFVQVRDVIFDLIEKCRDKGPLTPSTSTALGIIKRLSAEFHSSPQALDYCSDPGPIYEWYPTIQVGDSMKYITSVAMFYLGKDYRNLESRDLCEDYWNVVHEYLCTLLLVGDLFMYVGNIKYAKTHFTEGLKMSESCLLVTWSALFLSRLAQVALNSYETTKEADNFMKRALTLVQRYCVTMSPSPLMLKGLMSDDVLPCDMGDKQDFCSSCNSLHGNLTRRRQNLMLCCIKPDGKDVDQSGLTLFCHRDHCSQCFLAPVAQVVAELMWLQAEISQRNEGPGTSVLRSLSTAYCNAESLQKKCYKETVQSILEKTGIPVNVDNIALNKNYEWVLESQIRLAEVYFHLIYAGEAVEEVNMDSVLHFLNDILQSSKLAVDTNRTRIHVASAQLLRVHLKYISTQLKSSEERTPEILASGELITDDKIIETDVTEVKSFKNYWDAKKTLEFFTPLEPASTDTESDKPISKAKDFSGLKCIPSTTPACRPRPTTSVSQTEKRKTTRKIYSKNLFVFDDSENSDTASKIVETVNQSQDLSEMAKVNLNKLTEKSSLKTKALNSLKTKTLSVTQENAADQLAGSLQNMCISSSKHTEESLDDKGASLPSTKLATRKRQSPLSSKPHSVACDECEEQEKLKEVMEVAKPKKAKTGQSTRQKSRVKIEAPPSDPTSEECIDVRSDMKAQNADVAEAGGINVKRRRKMANQELESEKNSAVDVVLQEIDNKSTNAVKREVRPRRERKTVSNKGKENDDQAPPRRGGRRKKTGDSPELERAAIDSKHFINLSPLGGMVVRSPIYEKDELEEKLDLERSLLFRDVLLSADSISSKLIKARPPNIEAYYSPIEIPRGRRKGQTQEESKVPPVTSKGKRILKGRQETNVSEHKPHEAHAENTEIKSLENSLKRLQHFPQSFVYSQISRSLAAEEFNRHASLEIKSKSRCDQVDQSRIAAYLTESMHVTFRHIMIRNLGAKLKKCARSKVTCERDEPSDWAELEGDELSSEVKAMSEALSKLKASDQVDTLSHRLKDIPSEWTMVQLTVVNYDPLNPGKGQLLVTRMSSAQDPVTLEIPPARWLSLMRVLRVYEAAIIHQEKLSPAEYWTYRYKNDTDMQNLTFYLQEVILAGHKWFLRGKVNLSEYPSVGTLIETATSVTADQIYQQLGYKLDQKTLKVVFEVLLCAHEQDVESMLQSMWPKDVADAVTKALLELQSQVVKLYGERLQVTRGPVILLLDKTLNKLPWECMPDLAQETITRMPSLSALQAFLALHTIKRTSGFQHGVDRDNVVAVIDPETNLSNAVNVLLPQLERYKGWTSLVQKAPTVADLKNFLKNHSLYLYCGHGWGNQFVGGDDLQMFRAKAAAVLMGCQSGKLDYKSKLDGDGGPLYFLLAGCPSVIGNLWLVTDKDIDKLTSKFTAEWMAQTKPVTMSQILSIARKVCKLQGLNGFAPVIYGLPVLMNN
ncbi:separin [Biomphalaria glabrata]|uniref:separase n=1 Tax=Biomphalaria glabrata TaxID=6526 RepID=A0A9W2YAE3_BIOGL|nr:uncharacterized protein LOC106051823 [Biomphalaria glabrata]KAI8743789.1 separin-like [Biomphalaria glabrata]